MEEKNIESYYKNEAKRFVDMLFDVGVFNEKATRNSMQELENLLAYYLQSYADTAKKIADFNYRWDDL